MMWRLVKRDQITPGRLGAGAAAGGLIGLLATALGLPSFVSYWGDWSWLIVLAAVAGAIAWPLHRFTRGLTIGVTAALALLWLAVAFTPLCAWLADGLARRDPLRDADAVFVLGSRLQDDGDFTSQSQARLLRGLELLAAGRAPRLIVSEQAPPAPSYAEAAQRLVRAFGLTQPVLFVGPIASTRDEAVQVSELCGENGWRTVLLVTSPVHSRRAAATFEHVGLEVVAAPCAETSYDLETLDRPGERVEAFDSIMHERLGMWVYRRRGWVE